MSYFMALEKTSTLAPSPVMEVGKKKKSAAKAIFDSMRAQVAAVFPDNDAEAWQWTDESFETYEIKRPERKFEQWMKNNYVDSDEFSKRLVRRMFGIWQEMENEGFVANDKELYEHQKALFAWIALSTATGIRDQIANLLVRSPYGSGKSLVAGLVGLAFRQVQQEMMDQGKDTTTVPSGVLLGLRKEHMMQNALGKQFAVLQPPYTVERADVNVYWKNLAAHFGPDFSDSFDKPKGHAHPLYTLFNISKDVEATDTPQERVSEYIKANITSKGWGKVKPAKRRKITETLEQLVAGTALFIPDIYNVPQLEKPLPREEMYTEEAAQYRGDSAFAFTGTQDYRVKTTHPHLALDPKTHTTKPNTENPSKILIAYGTMVTRAPESIRKDVRDEIMSRGILLLIDEAGAFTPGSLGDSMCQLNGGYWPYMVGFTGGDRGIEGWQRSPTISTEKMIELGLMKPIAFQGIGDAQNPPAQGTEEAWSEYRKRMFTDEKTATTLGLPQPHELDTVVVVPTGNVREYAHRIKMEHNKRRIPIKIWCFDPASGDSRWSIIVNGFNAPKNEGDPKRILVAPPSQMSEALHLHAECYDILANMSKHPVDQTRGRLGHIRNDENGKLRNRARTYFRMQWLEGARGEAYIREVAKMMGYDLEDENETWQALRCMIDLDAHERDGKRRGLSEPEPIPDSSIIQRRKKRRASKTQWTPLKATSPLVIEQQRKAAERQARKSAAALSGEAHTTLQANAFQPRKNDEYTVTDGNESITIIVNERGFPMNLEALADKLAPYGESFALLVKDAHQKGQRGQALAQTTFDEFWRFKHNVISSF